MQYKDILVYLDNGASNAARVETALALAAAHQAHLTGVALKPDETRGVEGQTGTDVASEPETIVEAFLEQARSAGVEAEGTVMSCRGSRAPRKLAAYARNFDLTVMRQLNPNNESTLDGVLAEEILFGSGRPVLYIPFSGARNIPPKRAVIGWDGSRATTRATHDALPLLQTMEKVELVIIGKSSSRMSKPLRRAEVMKKHLRRHGIQAEVVFTSLKEDKVALTLLKHLKDSGADLLVMGGYGTSTLHQFLFGGVTHTIFKQMNTPVCMSH